LKSRQEEIVALSIDSKNAKPGEKLKITPMKRFAKTATLILLLAISHGANATAADAPPDQPYSGDLWTRSTLSGDWGGMRNQLAAKGIVFDLSLTQAAQGIVHGGKDTGWKYGGGRGDINLSLDTQKLGLWPGGFLNVEAEGNFIPDDTVRKSINGRTGALMSVYASQLFPKPSGDNFNLPALNFTQFLSPHFGLTIGKYATVTSTSGDMNEFAHGKGDTKFMNTALNINPVMLTTIPYSTLGTGLIALPTKDPNQAIVTFFVLSTTGSASTSGFDDLNDDNLSFVGEGRLRTDFFGMTGHQLFGALYSNKKFTSIDQNALFIFENGAFEEKKGSWNIHYNFDQYLYEPKKGSGEGIGIFGRFGASDGSPNFMHYFYSLGIGGKGMIPGRSRDRFGLGFYYIDVKNPDLQGVFRDRKLLRDEYGFEAFYNVAITPWLLLTPDIQVVRGAQRDQFTIGNLPGPLGLPFIASRKSVGMATILGLRLQMVF
jgi:porin